MLCVTESLCFVFQEKAAAVLGAYRRHHGAGASVLSLAELRAICSDVCADESTLCTALLQLQRDKQVTVSLHDGEKVSRRRRARAAAGWYLRHNSSWSPFRS